MRDFTSPFTLVNQNIKSKIGSINFKKGFIVFRYKFIGKEGNKPFWGTQCPLIEFIKNII